MPDVVSDEQWAGARALAEGQAPTLTRIASAMGIHFSTVCHRASEDDWKGLDFRKGPVKKAHKALIEMAARVAAGLPADQPPKPLDGDEIAIPESTDLPRDVSSEVGTVMAARAGETRQQRLARMGEMILSQTDRMLTRAELTGRPPDRHHVAALLAMTQLAERLSVETQMTALAQQEKDDDELARLYQWMDDNIVRLAYGICTRYLEKEGVGDDVVRQFDIISGGFERIMNGAEEHRKAFTDAVHAWEMTHGPEEFAAVIANMPPETPRKPPEQKRLEHRTEKCEAVFG